MDVVLAAMNPEIDLYIFVDRFNFDNKNVRNKRNINGAKSAF